jgi:hypothetical protein
MSQREKAAKNGGTPETSAKQTRRKTRSVKQSSAKKGPGAARTVQDGRRNEMIQSEWRNGRDQASLAAEFGLSERRVYEIIKECREGRIEALELDAPWRDQRWADELLLFMQAAINETRETQIRARREGNTANELGALKARIPLLKELKSFLQETGRLKGLLDLKHEAEVAEIWNAVRRVFHEGLMSEHAVRAFEKALGFNTASGEEQPAPSEDPAPEHWSPNRTERRIAAERQRETARRKDLEARLEDAEREAAEQREAAKHWEATYRESPEAHREAEAKLAAVRGERPRRTPTSAPGEPPTDVEQPPSGVDGDQQAAEDEQAAEADSKRVVEAKEEERRLDPWGYGRRAAAG